MIFIGNFLHLTNQEQDKETERRHGEFTLIVEAVNLNEALEGFRQKLAAFRARRSLFEGDCTIYLIQLLEMQTVPEGDPLMVHFTSTAGDPVMPYIGCSVPLDQSDGCKIYDWENNKPLINGSRETPFLEFKA